MLPHAQTLGLGQRSEVALLFGRNHKHCNRFSCLVHQLLLPVRAIELSTKLRACARSCLLACYSVEGACWECKVAAARSNVFQTPLNLLSIELELLAKLFQGIVLVRESFIRPKEARNI